MTVDYTKLQVHKEKANTTFENNNEIFRLLLGMLLLSEFHEAWRP